MSLGEGLYGKFPAKRAVISFATAAAQTVVAAVAGHKIIVIGGFIKCTTTGQTLTWRSNTNAVSGAMAFATSDMVWADHNDDHGIFETAPGEALVLLMGAASQVSGYITYALVKAG